MENPLKIFREYADYGIDFFVENEGFADNVRITGKPVTPMVVAEDDNVPAPLLVFLEQKSPSQYRPGPQN